MAHEILTLNNGIRLIHKEIDAPISHFGILVNSGTRDENPAKMGIAHFVEHTIFKGTKKRKGFQVLKRLEDVGGELNASTSKEETYFYASFLSPDYQRVVELLSDIFFNATFPEKELEKEKDVVLEEIKYYQDTPAELIFDDFENLLFGAHPLSMNILGNKKTVKSIRRDDIFDFIKNNYTDGNVVLASVGNIAAKKLVSLCNRFFAAQQLPTSSRQRVPFQSYEPRTVRLRKNSAQTHAMLGNIAYPFGDERQDAFMLLINLLGGQGMNTRLNMAIREKRGLAYAVEANYAQFSDCGFFAIYIGCDHHTLNKCIELTFKELEKLKTQKLGTLQLHYAQKQFIGQIAIANESKLTEMLALGRSTLYFDEVDTLKEAIAKIEAVTSSDLLAIANEIFIPEQISQLIYTK